MDETFICAWCRQKSEDPEEYTFPIEDCENPEDDPELRICKECAWDVRNEEYTADDIEDGLDIWKDYEGEEDDWE
ncbi:MAG: hypothetical protein V1835_05880 [Candidatus Micrarchaeota archaeon]